MKLPSRRRFISQLTFALPLVTVPRSGTIFAEKKGMFIHHVFFWLKQPDSKEDKAKLIEGLKKLAKVKTIEDFYIGQPAATYREVVDRSYSISWCVFFKNAADQDSYQVDPIHLKFVEECSSLWSKVIVYDSVNIE